MRAVVAGFAFVAVLASGPARAQPLGPYSSTEGKYTVRFPGQPKVTTRTADTAVGELTVNVATFANPDGSIYMVSYTDLPTAPKVENYPMLFTGVRDGVKGTGKQVGADREFEFGADKLPGREFVVDKGKQRIKIRAIIRDSRLYQVAVIGPTDFAGGKDANLFFESFELSK